MKKYFSLIILILFFTIIFSNNIAFAAVLANPVISPNNKSETNAKILLVNNACTKATGRLSDAEIKLNQEIAKKTQARTVNETKRENDRTKIDTQLIQSQTEADQTRALKYTELANKLSPTTPTQIKAWADFQTNVKLAITTRRDAVKTANTTFRQAMDTLISTRQTGVDQALTNRLQAIETTKTEIANTCTNPENVNLDTFKNTFKTKNQNIDNALTGAIESETTFNNQVKALQTTRKNSYEAAKVKFQADMDKAKTDLKTAYSI